MTEERSEQWKPVKGYEELYAVSNLGRVKSLERTVVRKNGRKYYVREKIMKPVKRSDGYLQVMLSNGGVKKYHLVHRLVAEAFIPNPDNLPQVNHKIEGDEGKLINTVESLEWCDIPYNINYGTHNERMAKAKSKTVYQYDKKTHELVREWQSTNEVERQTGFKQTNISACARGKIKTYKGYVWSYTRL